MFRCPPAEACILTMPLFRDCFAVVELSRIKSVLSRLGHRDRGLVGSTHCQLPQRILERRDPCQVIVHVYTV